MGNHNQQEKAQELQRQLERELELELKRELSLVLDNIRDVASSFRSDPGQISLFMDQLQSEGQLTPLVRQQLGVEFTSMMGQTWADKATGVTPQGKSTHALGAAIMADAQTSLARMHAPRPSDAITVRPGALGLESLGNQAGLKPNAPSMPASFTPSYGAQSLQMKGVGDEERDTDAIHEEAAKGVEGSGSSLPHAERIQEAFGDHDIGSIEAHVGGQAADASEAIGARAYARGNKIAFKDTPDLHTAAHEAAHIIQQRAGVSLEGGVGKTGDAYEQHADAVADAVVAGRDASELLNAFADPTYTKASPKGAVQKAKLSGTLAGDQTFAIQDNKNRIALSGEIFNHIRNAIIEAKSLINGAMSALDTELSEDLKVKLRLIFGAKEATMEGVIPAILKGYQLILAGLDKQGLVIKDESAEVIEKHKAEGHVNSAFGIRFGPIHTRFDMPSDTTAFNLIHEASHLFAATQDHAYFRDSFPVFETLYRELGGETDQLQVMPAIEGVGHTNADSFAIFAFAVADKPMPGNGGHHEDPVQQRTSGRDVDADTVQEAAAKGVSGSGGTLPYQDQIQESFGGHDVSGIESYTGGSATDASKAMGARAYATGNKVAFGQSPDLHTAAHEAAHVVQQRGGVSLKGGVGQAGDVYEQHADAVADKVVAGESAQGLLDQMAGSSGSDQAVQGKSPAATTAVQNKPVQFAKFSSEAKKMGAKETVEMKEHFSAKPEKEGTDIDRKITSTRAAIHNQILNKYKLDTATDEEKTGGVAIVAMGGSGAGKGTLLEQLKKENAAVNDYTTIDPDALKEDLPEYDNAHVLDGQKTSESTEDGSKAFELRLRDEKAEIVHDESSVLSKKMKRLAIKTGDSVILDGTGSNLEKYKTDIKALQERGYTVHLVMPFLNVEEGLARVAARKAETGRGVAEEKVREIYAAVNANFAQLKELLNVDAPGKDTWALYDSNVAKEVDIFPLIAQSGAVSDEAKWAEFCAAAGYQEDGTTQTGDDGGGAAVSMVRKVQLDANSSQSARTDQEIQQHAQDGVSGSGGTLPYQDQIQASFGGHDVSGIESYTGGSAADASKAMGARAYATGNKVAFGQSPDLHTAAHEAAHVVQQRGGVSLKGGVGQAGDMYEQHADAVADAVVAGKDASGLLDQFAGSGGSGVSRKVQHRRTPESFTDSSSAQDYAWEVDSTARQFLRPETMDALDDENNQRYSDFSTISRLFVEKIEGPWRARKYELQADEVAGYEDFYSEQAAKERQEAAEADRQLQELVPAYEQTYSVDLQPLVAKLNALIPQSAQPDTASAGDWDTDTTAELTPDMVQEFKVEFENGIQVSLIGDLLESWLGGMPITGGATSTTQFGLQAVFHIQGALDDPELLKLATRGGSYSSYSGSLSPTLGTVWKGAVDSTKINMGVYLAVGALDGSLAKLSAPELGAEIAWQTGRSLIAESAATAVGNAVTIRCAAMGGRMGIYAGPVGIAVGFAVGAAVGACLDLLMTDKLKARFVDLFGGEEVGNREQRIVRAKQAVIDEAIRQQNPIVQKTRMMEDYLNTFNTARVRLDGQPYERHSMIKGASNRMTFNGFVSQRTANAFSALNTVRDRWSLTGDEHVIVQDYAMAGDIFRDMLNTTMPMVFEDAVELIRASQARMITGPDQDENYKVLANGQWASVPRDPVPRISMGVAYAQEFQTLLALLANYADANAEAQPLEEQLERTTGFSW